ncbi:HlyC/CorC family transporter [Desulfuromonas sp. TF]|jgi:putative hemolysin|uniref:HlyC/CorC family transporter n=1 Tax=Desulfuromonas sp. TF TaxID=1232410 RepID=UPI000400886C|nr:hemolysin family protein [Desulfuromonas sp. TF]
MSDDQLLHLIGLGILFVFSAFFSGSETALMSIDKLRVKYLVQKNRRGAQKLDALLSRPDHLLGAILVGNNLVNIAASVFATTFFVGLYGEQGELLTILILTPLLLILSEVCPKTYAAQYPEKVSFMVLRPIIFGMTILMPVVWLVTGVSRLLTRFIKGEEERPIISEDEIRSIIRVGEETGVVAKEQRRMLHGIFELSQIRVRDVMIPRTEVAGIDVNTPFEDVLRLTQQARHSRFPVFEESLDNVVGIIHSKDILNYVDRPQEFSIREVARPPYFVPESKPIETLLQSFRRKRVHLAVVVDEYGGVEGIVTLEDIVEEIVGEIQDEYDVEEVLIREIAPGRYLVDGSTSLRSINRRFGLQLSEEHANTLAGFLLRTMGSIPEVGDSCQSDGTRFIVRKVEDRRVEEIEMLLATPPSK